MAVASIIMLVLVSCEKIRNMAVMNINLPYAQTLSVPTIDTTGFPPEGMAVSFPTLALATNSIEVLNKYDIENEKIVAITLKSFIQKIVRGENRSFDFMDKIQVYISANGLSEKLMAYNNNIPKNTDSISMACIGGDLKPYLVKDTIYLRVYGQFNKVPEQADYELDFNFGLLADMLKKSKE